MSCGVPVPKIFKSPLILVYFFPNSGQFSFNLCSSLLLSEIYLIFAFDPHHHPMCNRKVGNFAIEKLDKKLNLLIPWATINSLNIQSETSYGSVTFSNLELSTRVLRTLRNSREKQFPFKADWLIDFSSFYRIKTKFIT